MAWPFKSRGGVDGEGLPPAEPARPSIGTVGLASRVHRAVHMVVIRRLGVPRWTLAVADQAVVALTNFVLAVAIARAADLAALGVYSLLSATLLTCLGLNRTLVTDPWIAGRETAGPHRPAVTTWVAFAAVVSFLVLFAVVIVFGRDQYTWLLCAPIAALLLVQDTGRYAAFRRNEPARALISDSSLLLGVGVGSAAGLLSSVDNPVATILLGWLSGYLLALLPSWRMAVARPASWSTATAWWIRTCRRLALPLLLDSLAFAVSVTLTLYALAAVASADVVGVVRVVTTLFSPVAIVFTGLNMWLIPHMTRTNFTDTRRLRRRATLALLVVGIFVTVLAIAAGPMVALWVFGPNSEPSRWALALAGLSTILTAVAVPWLTSVRVFGSYGIVAQARLVAGVLALVLILSVGAVQTVEGYITMLVWQNAAVLAAAVLATARLGGEGTSPSEQDVPSVHGPRRGTR